MSTEQISCNICSFFKSFRERSLTRKFAKYRLFCTFSESFLGLAVIYVQWPFPGCSPLLPPWTLLLYFIPVFWDCHANLLESKGCLGLLRKLFLYAEQIFFFRHSKGNPIEEEHTFPLWNHRSNMDCATNCICVMQRASRSSAVYRCTRCSVFVFVGVCVCCTARHFLGASARVGMCGLRISWAHTHWRMCRGRVWGEFVWSIVQCVERETALCRTCRHSSSSREGRSGYEG